MKITDFPHVRAVLQQIDFAQLLREEDCKAAEELAVKISQTCAGNAKSNFGAMLALFLYLEQTCRQYSRLAGLSPKARVQ